MVTLYGLAHDISEGDPIEAPPIVIAVVAIVLTWAASRACHYVQAGR
jgi:hypothetical protein